MLGFKNKSQKAPTVNGEYFHTVTLGRWDKTGFYCLPDPEFLATIPVSSHSSSVKQIVNACAISIDRRHCSIIPSTDLVFGEWFAMVHVNENGEIIPYITVSSNNTGITNMVNVILAEISSFLDRNLLH